MYKLNAEESSIIEMVRQFAESEIRPIAKIGDETDEFPLETIDKMKELGFFGLTIAEEYGGSGISSMAYANVFEELSFVWMTAAGVLGTHSLMATVLSKSGTEEQKKEYLPQMATGEKWGALRTY